MNTVSPGFARFLVAILGLFLAIAGRGRAAEVPAAGSWPLRVPFCGSGDGRAFAPALAGFGNCPSNGPCDLATVRDGSWSGLASPYKLIRMRIHAVSESNGSNPSATPAEIERMIRVLNNGFRPARIQFLATYRTVSNSIFRNVGTDLIGGVTSSDRMKDALAQNPGSQLNLFITGYTPGNCGIARFPWEPVALTSRGGFIMADYSVAPTRFGVHTNILTCVVHEVGHVCGLLHTFAGVTEVGGCAAGCREVVGRPVTEGNCKGDFCADTVPEPSIGVLTGACSAPGTLDSCNGQPYSVLNPGNFMNYYVACYSQFTPQQIARMHCWIGAALSSWLIGDTTAPNVAITAPMDGTNLTSLSTVTGTAADNLLLDSVTVSIREQDGAFNRWWNGTNWQATAFPLPAVLTGSNWVLAPSVVRPPLNSGITYLLTVSAVDSQFNASATSVTIRRPIDTLAWDPGLSHAGTQVKSQPHLLGGYHIYRIVTSNTTHGAWRSALTVTNGEANLRLSLGGSPLEQPVVASSSRPGSDGWVLTGLEFSADQEWFYAVESLPGGRWNLVTGEPFVMNLGTLPGPAAAADTTATIGAEGWRFFRTIPSVGTLAWRLWLHGATNDVLVARDRLPVVGPSGVTQLDHRRPRAMLAVPPFLEPATTHYMGVPGVPGTNVILLSSEQPVVDQAFASERNGVVVSGFPYTTYRISVPVDQIAWELRVQSLAGDPQLSVRRGSVPNEDENDGYSEVTSLVADALTLVPPVLRDGIFYTTVYAAGPHSFNFRNGEPAITVRPFSSITTNDLRGQSGARYYVVNDLPAQTGALGWELELSNHPPKTRLALRRNAVPGSWRYRSSGVVFHYSIADYLNDDGRLQRPGHPADIWYAGVFQAATHLGPFVLQTRPLVPRPVAFDNGQVTAADQRMYYAVTVPPGVLGWKLDLTASNAAPVVRACRGRLPSDGEPAMPFGGPNVVLAPPFLEPGTWYVEVKGMGASTYGLRSQPLELLRPAWNMPADGGPVSTPGLAANGPVFGDSGVGPNGEVPAGGEGTDLANGDLHYFALNVPPGNVGLLRTELTAISGDPDVYIRVGGVPTFSHPAFGSSGPDLIDHRLTGARAQYGNWVPSDGKVDRQLAPGPWYVAVHAAGNTDARYRLRLSTGLITTNLVAGSILSNQVAAAGDWRYIRLLVPSNAPTSLEATFHQKQGDVAMYFRDTVPPGDSETPGHHHSWVTDAKNDGPYAVYDEPGTRTFTTPSLRPGHNYYLGFRPQGEDATYDVSYQFASTLIDATNVVAFAGGGGTVVLAPLGVAHFRVPVPADATSWRHYCTNADGIFVWLEQGTLPDPGRSPDWSSGGLANPSLVAPLIGWPWVANEAYFITASNSNAGAQSFTLRMDGRTTTTDDTDSDGLPDGWELEHFGNLKQNGRGDSDGDGIANADELAEATDPADSTSLRPRVTVMVNGVGTVVREPNLPSYDVGQVVTLTAVADPGWTFAGWSGAVTTNRNPLTPILASNVTLTATFIPGGVGLVVLSDPQLTAGGQFRFIAEGLPGVLVIEASADLENWSELQSVSPFTGHAVLIVDPMIPVRFFRGRWRP